MNGIFQSIGSLFRSPIKTATITSLTLTTSPTPDNTNNNNRRKRGYGRRMNTRSRIREHGDGFIGMNVTTRKRRRVSRRERRGGADDENSGSGSGSVGTVAHGDDQNDVGSDSDSCDTVERNLETQEAGGLSNDCGDDGDDGDNDDDCDDCDDDDDARGVRATAAVANATMSSTTDENSPKIAGGGDEVDHDVDNSGTIVDRSIEIRATTPTKTAASAAGEERVVNHLEEKTTGAATTTNHANGQLKMPTKTTADEKQGEDTMEAVDNHASDKMDDENINGDSRPAVDQSLQTQMTTPTAAAAETRNLSNENDNQGDEAAAGANSNLTNSRRTATRDNVNIETTTSPLSDFFSHVLGDGTIDNDEKAERVMSPKEWKEARKAILRDFLEHRLSRADAEEEERATDAANNNNNGDNDDWSFSSDVLDGPFECSQSPIDTAATETQKLSCDDPEEEDDDMHLETQPQTSNAASTPKSNNDSRTSKSMPKGSARASEDDTPSSFLQTQEEFANTNTSHSLDPTQAPHGTVDRRSEGIYGGIKRKLGYHTTNHLEEGERNQLASEKARTPHDEPTSNPRDENERGLMWNGRFESIPHITDTAPTPCSKLDELDLSSSTLNLSLCRVLRVWNIRSTKRMDKLAFSSSRNREDGDGTTSGDAQRQSTEADSHHPDVHRSMMPFDSYEDDGPLNTIYKRVFSIEIAQILNAENDDDDDTRQCNRPSTTLAPTSPSIADMATAAFSDGRHRLDRETSRRLRHQIRRARVFFYDGWADAASAAFGDIRTRAKKSKTSEKCTSFLASLECVPAKCILPRAIVRNGVDPRVERYVRNPFGDEERGSMSSYCICMGDRSSIRFDDERLCFGEEDMGIRLVRAPGVDRCGEVGEGNEDVVVDYDAVITMASVRDRGNNGRGYFTECEESELAKRYVRMREKRATTCEPIASHPEVGMEQTTASSSVGGTGIDAGAAGSSSRNTIAGASSDNTASPSSRAVTTPSRMTSGVETAETGSIVAFRHHRPRSVVPLCGLLSLLIRNNMKRLKDPITVYGVVLGFSPPSLTRTEEWKMSISFIDETLPVSNRARVAATAGRSTPNNNSNNDENSSVDPRELHVPSVTLVIFSKDKTKLPAVRSAGDVIVCAKVILQEWSGEPQLCARRTSRISIVRPRRPRCPGGEELHDPTPPDDYCSDEAGRDNLCWPLVDGLWRWGQRRLSAHPTMSPNCYLSIAEAVGSEHDCNNNDNDFERSVSGDLTAAVTAIIAMPESLRRRDSPRGYLRLWDGTGPSRTDPLPLSVTSAGKSNQQPQDDPPEQVLTTIEKIVRDISASGPPNAAGLDGNVIQAPIALCGRVINAIIWEENLWNLIHRESMIDMGSFVRLRNVNNTKLPTTGTNCLSVHNRSSLTPLPFDAYEIKGLLKEHAARIQKGDPTNPTSAILPVSSNHVSNRSIRPSTNVVLEMKNHGVSMIEQCLQTPAPATFTLQFEVSHTVPACNPTSIDGIKSLYTKKKDGTSSFRFALHIKDASSEVDVLCLGKVAEGLLGITTRDITSNNDESSEKCEGALETLREIMSPSTICEGKVRSILGKDGKLYFILKSMFCISAETVEI